MENKIEKLVKQAEISETKIVYLKSEKEKLQYQKTYNLEDRITYDESKKEIKKAKIIDKVLFVIMAITFFLIFNGLNLILGALAVLTATGFLVNNNFKMLESKQIIRDLDTLEIEGIKNTIEEAIKLNQKNLTIEETKLNSIINAIKNIEKNMNNEVITITETKEEEIEEPAKVKIFKKYN